MQDSQSLPSYDELAEAFREAGSVLEVSEAHGLLCGILCAGGSTDPAYWYQQIFDAPPDDEGQRQVVLASLKDVHRATVGQLNDPDMGFELLLPDSDHALEERIQALGDWSHGYLSGLGLGGYSGRDGLPDEIGEFIQDLGEIGRIDPHAGEGGEDEEEAFFEVQEYVRMGVLLVNEELQPLKAPPQIH